MHANLPRIVQRRIRTYICTCVHIYIYIYTYTYYCTYIRTYVYVYCNYTGTFSHAYTYLICGICFLGRAMSVQTLYELNAFGTHNELRAWTPWKNEQAAWFGTMEPEQSASQGSQPTFRSRAPSPEPRSLDAMVWLASRTITPMPQKIHRNHHLGAKVVLPICMDLCGTLDKWVDTHVARQQVHSASAMSDDHVGAPTKQKAVPEYSKLKWELAPGSHEVHYDARSGVLTFDVGILIDLEQLLPQEEEHRLTAQKLQLNEYFGDEPWVAECLSTRYHAVPRGKPKGVTVKNRRIAGGHYPQPRHAATVITESDKHVLPRRSSTVIHGLNLEPTICAPTSVSGRPGFSQGRSILPWPERQIATQSRPAEGVIFVILLGEETRWERSLCTAALHAYLRVQVNKDGIYLPSSMSIRVHLPEDPRVRLESRHDLYLAPTVLGPLHCSRRTYVKGQGFRLESLSSTTSSRPAEDST